jgi:hypothetical protein
MDSGERGHFGLLEKGDEGGMDRLQATQVLRPVQSLLQGNTAPAFRVLDQA